MNKVPSRDKNRKSLPKCFSQYASCRTKIDCTEFFSANSKAMNISNAMYSSYKSRITLKACIGVAPNGCVTLCSKAYSGSTSDKDIVADCGRNIRTRRYYGRQRFSDWWSSQRRKFKYSSVEINRTVHGSSSHVHFCHRSGSNPCGTSNPACENFWNLGLLSCCLRPCRVTDFSSVLCSNKF